MEKVCIQCGQMFHKSRMRSLASWRTARFCNQTCRAKWWVGKHHKARPVKECAVCHTIFSKPTDLGTVAWNIRKYCSQPCTIKARMGHPVSDETKNKLRETSTGYRHTEESLRKMRIAQKGRIAWNKKSPVYLLCMQCGQKKQIKWVDVGHAKFCSTACAGQYSDQGKTKEHQKIRSSARYRQWRRQVFERDNFTCQECGQKGGTLNADHIKRFADFPELRFEISNGRTLCESCHRQTTTFGNRKQSVLSIASA